MLKGLILLLVFIVQAAFAQEDIRTLHSAIGKITHCEFSPDGSKAVACSKLTDFYGEKIASIMLFDTQSEKLTQELPVHATFATFSPDNAVLMYWDYGKGLVVRNMTSNAVKIILEGTAENVVFKGKFSRDGKILAVGGVDGKVKVIDATTYKVLHVLQSNDEMKLCIKLDFMSDGTLVSVANGTTKTWDVQTGKEIRKQARTGINTVVPGFATETNRVVMCYQDSTFIAESGTGKILARNDFANFYNGAFSPKGNLYVLSDNEGVYAFNGDATFGKMNGVAIPACEWMDIDRNESKVIIASEVNVLMVDFDYFKKVASRNE